MVVDIGCGSGNITKILSNEIDAKRIVAFDQSPEMVSYCKTNYADKHIEYVTADISKSD